MEKEFVSYTLALALKEKGFDEPCLRYYYVGILKESHLDNLASQKEAVAVLDGLLAPLTQQVFRWFREKHGLFGYVKPVWGGTSYWYSWMIKNIKANEEEEFAAYSSPEQAEEECVTKLISLI